MNVERDSDRQLRAWASEGVDRAPERFVWAALDEIERIPQRTAWRTGLDGLALRLLPAAALVGVAAVILVAIAIIAQVVAPNLGVGVPRRFETSDLPGIVLWDDTIPATWTLDNLVSNPDEVRYIPLRSAAAIDGAAEVPRGYLGGRYTSFSGPDSIFMSWAALFATDADASATLPLYQREMAAADAWGLGPGEPIEFGDGGFVYSGETTALMGGPGSSDPVRAAIYLWREGNLLLAIGGWFDFDPAELRAVAEGMDARADAVSQASIDLASIIVAPEAAPPGMDHDESGAGRDALTMLIISGREAEFAALAGFVDARWTTFSGDTGALLSLAMAFDDSLTGDVAYHRFVGELSDADGYGFGSLDLAALGFEGVCDTGANPALDGLIETICIWRSGPFVLIAGGPMPPAALEAIAADMDARLP
jgi:hypothetical protein